MSLLKDYLKNLYENTIQRANNYAYLEVKKAVVSGGSCLDCGAGNGWVYEKLKKDINFNISDYYGIEWNEQNVLKAREKGLNVIKRNLNEGINFESNKFQCVYAFSVLEHLLNGCFWMEEARRTLKDNGTLVILTPNISAWFTVFQLITGNMPSIGPNPDSRALFKEAISANIKESEINIEGENPMHRHLIIFSYKILELYLRKLGFKEVKGRAFGLYPFPSLAQPVLEKIDPWHCHQMVFIAKK